jgi:diguanylate cyclase (GGDEF)-like protein
MVSKTVSNVIRRLDVLSRWGGEEFVVILPKTDVEVLEEVAERIRIFIERSFIIVRGETLTVTASIGATMAKPEDTPETVFHRADDLMYSSKISGRNRVTLG